MQIKLYYDQECPFCRAYANYVKIKQTHNLILVDVRDNKQTIKELQKKGLDINDGFIIEVDNNKFYQGSEAILFLNEISNNKIYFKNNIFFTGLVYPFIKQLRKLLLFCLNKKSRL